MSLYLTGIASKGTSSLFREMELEGHTAARMEDLEIIPKKIVVSLTLTLEDVAKEGYRKIRTITS